MVGCIVKASEIAKEVGQFHDFCGFSYIFLRVFRGPFKGTFWWIWEHNIYTVFINFDLDFGVFAQKCLKPCVNGVLKFKFFFLNLSSFLAGVRVRTSKYIYMDIRAITYFVRVYQLFCDKHFGIITPTPRSNKFNEEKRHT